MGWFWVAYSTTSSTNPTTFHFPSFLSNRRNIWIKDKSSPTKWRGEVQYKENDIRVHVCIHIHTCVCVCVCVCVSQRSFFTERWETWVQLEKSLNLITSLQCSTAFLTEQQKYEPCPFSTFSHLAFLRFHHVSKMEHHLLKLSSLFSLMEEVSLQTLLSMNNQNSTCL